MLVGALVLFGWVFDFPALTDLVSGSVTMKANAALCFVLCGAAMWLLQMRGRHAGRTERVCALAAGGIALLTLGEYATGWNLGIDEFLVHDTGPAVATSHPGRMGPNTAISFVLTAGALWLMSRPAGMPRRPLILGWLGALVAGIGLFALLGYAAEFSLGYGWWSLTGMAVHTALLFVLLGAAVLRFAWREAERRWVIGPWLTAGFACGLGLLVAVAALSHRSTTDLVEAAALAKHTQEVIARIRALLSSLDESQSAARGYVITGEEVFLPLSEKAIPKARKHLLELGRLTADNAGQQARLGMLEKRIGEWLEAAQRMIDLRRTAGFEAAAQRIVTGRDKALMDQIRADLGEMEAEEETLLVLREAQSGAVTARTFAILPAGVLAGALLLTFGFAAPEWRGGQTPARDRCAAGE